MGAPNERLMNARWRTAAILNKSTNCHLCNDLTNVDQIWHGAAYWPSGPCPPLKIPTSENSTWRTAAIFKSMVVSHGIRAHEKPPPTCDAAFREKFFDHLFIIMPHRTHRVQQRCGLLLAMLCGLCVCLSVDITTRCATPAESIEVLFRM